MLEVGIRNPKEVKKDVLECGEVGWVCGSIKSIKDVRVGDTITHADHPDKRSAVWISGNESDGVLRFISD